jgi:hypothetical protein
MAASLLSMVKTEVIDPPRRTALAWLEAHVVSTTGEFRSDQSYNDPILKQLSFVNREKL